MFDIRFSVKFDVGSSSSVIFEIGSSLIFDVVSAKRILTIEAKKKKARQFRGSKNMLLQETIYLELQWKPLNVITDTVIIWLMLSD
jgi:hypothetical protein